MKRDWIREQQHEQIALCQRGAELLRYLQEEDHAPPEWLPVLQYLILLVTSREKQLKEKMP